MGMHGTKEGSFHLRKREIDNEVVSKIKIMLLTIETDIVRNACMHARAVEVPASCLCV